jgi:hypothetical protein
MPERNLLSPAVVWGLVLVYVAAYLVVVYGAYPFDGMVVNESWNFHDNEVRQFKFPGYGDSTKTGSPKTFLYDPASGAYDFSFLHSRRGLVPIIYLLFETLSVGDHVVFMNVLCVAVLAANLLLFAYVVWRLAGPGLLLSSVVVYSLYPFAAASHFLQVIVVNNLAVTLFLLSFSLFLKAIAAPASPRRLLGWGLPALLSYWLSIFNHEYALFLSPLYLYVALYERHGGAMLWRFTDWRAPSVFLGAAFLAVSAAAVAFLVSDVPSVLLYAPRFRELAAALHAPEWLVPFLTGGANAVLFYLSALFSNLPGYLLYPTLLLRRDLPALPDWWVALAVAGGLALVVVWGVASTTKRQDAAPAAPGRAAAFVPLVGAVWAVLAYLPFATSIGYPRIVGMMADRVNILAACGVSLTLGWMIHRLITVAGSAPSPRRTLVFACLWGVACLLLLNRFVQREYYVDAYRKEQEVARVVLRMGEHARRKGKTLVVLLDRPTKVTYPRARLMAALDQPGLAGKAKAVGAFLVDRYFAEDVLSTSFHLQGLYLFGCCPDSGQQTFRGYAKLWAVPRVAVFKLEEPFRLYDEGDAWRIGYRDTRVYSRSFGTDSLTTFPKRDTELVVLNLDESFFHFKGPVAYRLRPPPEAVAGLVGSAGSL